MRSPLLFAIMFVLLLPCAGFSQDNDSVFVQPDSLVIPDDATIAEEEENVIFKALPDSAAIHARKFNEEKLSKLKQDSELDYKQPPTIAESLWARFLRWLSQLIGYLFNKAVTTDWGQVITYVVALAILVVIIMMILKVNAFKVLYSAEGGKMNYQVLDENIHEMDFEKLIREAMVQEDYRKGIRLYFLYALKLLSDKQLVDWKPGKTNHDYVAELGKPELKRGLNDLSFYFDYAWYGNFNITSATFHKAQGIFADWKEKLR